MVEPRKNEILYFFLPIPYPLIFPVLMSMFHSEFLDPISSFSVGYKGESNIANDSKKEDLSQILGI